MMDFDCLVWAFLKFVPADTTTLFILPTITIFFRLARTIVDHDDDDGIMMMRG